MGLHGGLDAWLSGGFGVGLALLAALLLGLRHATDPDHVTAVATLVFSGEPDVARRAGRLGLSWGVGHAVTLFGLGLPVVFLGDWIPPVVHRGAEFAVGVLIVALAARLLIRWRRGRLHAHVHDHGDVRHAHPHMHEGEGHEHAHAAALGRSPREAFGIGLVHGVGGSAGAGVLLVASMPERTAAVAALLVFALGTAASMAAISAILGFGLAKGRGGALGERLVPLVGFGSLLFGVWYAASAFQPF